MAKKTTSGTNPVRTGTGIGTGTARAKTGADRAPVPPAGTSLIEPQRDGMGVVHKDKGATMVVGPRLSMNGTSVVADAVYYDGGAEKLGSGPWLGEADKIAWLDEASGYECIVMRDTRGGFLGGYVGLPAAHPLHGFDHRAIPADLDIEVHGGLSYSKACQEGPTPVLRLTDEASRICHVPRGRVRHVPLTHGSEYRVQHDDAWWLGFTCDRIYDVVPGNRGDRKRFLAAETGAEYRDAGYVYRETVALAAHLRAIADGEPKPVRDGPPPPPLGLDPKAAG